MHFTLGSVSASASTSPHRTQQCTRRVQSQQTHGHSSSSSSPSSSATHSAAHSAAGWVGAASTSSSSSSSVVSSSSISSAEAFGAPELRYARRLPLPSPLPMGSAPARTSPGVAQLPPPVLARACMGCLPLPRVSLRTWPLPSPSAPPTSLGGWPLPLASFEASNEAEPACARARSSTLPLAGPASLAARSDVCGPLGCRLCGGAPASASSDSRHPAWKERKQGPSQQSSVPPSKHTEQISSLLARSRSAPPLFVLAILAFAFDGGLAGPKMPPAGTAFRRCSRPVLRWIHSSHFLVHPW
mmetsp:Transcript_16379/g.38947  ORF Transcript_16379/g.38947 Transcript_16379/m.38947 type:complete len:300 (+) Transcript_16379:1589-2488(+)